MNQHTKAPDLSPASARAATLLRRAHAHCAGDDAAWDGWAAAVIDSKGQHNNATISAPLVTDAFLRGLQVGLKAHLPVDSEELEAAKIKFERLTLKAYVRQETARSYAALAIGELTIITEACRNGEQALKKLGVTV